MYECIASKRSKLKNFAPKILLCVQLIVLSIRNANIVSDGKASELGIRNFPSQPQNSQLPILNSQLYIINVLPLSNTAFSWGISISTLKVQIFLTFLLKSFGDTEKSYTFASAFENERYLKLNEKRKSLKKAVKKEFFEKIYIRQIK